MAAQSEDAHLCPLCEGFDQAEVQCEACKQVWYCSAEHSAEHAAEHKAVCDALVGLAASGGGVTRLVITAGAGEPVGKGKRVSVHYTGTFPNGRAFDSSREKGKPFAFVPGKRSVIVGWDVGVPQMRRGERSTLVVSGNYGYGEEGAPPTIGPDQPLVFDVELLA
jgi:FKBP-type peptidyl-prolyl cis-trans isomerase